MSCSKGMVGCKSTCGHKQMVMEYRLARLSAEQQREYETANYPAELAEYKKLITFKEWLQSTATLHEEDFYSKPC